MASRRAGNEVVLAVADDSQVGVGDLGICERAPSPCLAIGREASIDFLISGQPQLAAATDLPSGVLAAVLVFVRGPSDGVGRTQEDAPRGSGEEIAVD